MTYEVDYTQGAVKDLEKLPQKVRERIIKRIDRLALSSRPGRHIRPLEGNFDIPLFSLRVGDYRIIHSFNDERLIIFIIEIGLRKKIYRWY